MLNALNFEMNRFLCCRRGFPTHKKDEKDFPSIDIVNLLFTLIDCVILGFGGLSTIPLFVFHSYLMCTNQTTWESVSRNKISYLKKFSEEINPFHMGYCANVYYFCCRCRPHRWNAVYKKSSSTLLLQEV